MHKSFLMMAAILAGMAVALGAFGAHTLKNILPEKDLIIYETGVKYQMYHSLALLLVGILYKEFGKKMLWPGKLFIVGICLFCGSLYIMTLLKLFHTDYKWIGIITPFGGIIFIAGWLLIAINVYKSFHKNKS